MFVFFLFNVTLPAVFCACASPKKTNLTIIVHIANQKKSLTKKICDKSEENEFIPTPASPIVYRRNFSREDGDVFSRLGAGQLDPTPGGSIKDFSGKVRDRIFIFRHDRALRHLLSLICR